MAETGPLQRCPEHGLAYVLASELSEGSVDPFLGKTLVNRFVVVGKLGAGSMGAVYRARQEAVGRDVALKIVRRDRAYGPETKVRFEREARAMSSLVSPHTVTVFDFGETDDGSWFLAMEMLVGETLGERLRRQGRMPWRSAIRIAREALQSLSEAHGKGIIHRDLKPDNLFLMKRPAASETEAAEMCKVLDFGIAKLQHDDQKVDQLETQAGTVFGTPRYMSPEQAQGVELDARSDLYSLGVILFQMLAGRAPFVDDDAVVVMAKHIKDPPPFFRSVAANAEVPEPIEQVVRDALEKARGARIQTAEQFIIRLQEAEAEVERRADARAGTTTAALAPVAGPPLSQRRPLSRWLWSTLALGALLTLGALAGIVVWWSPSVVPEASSGHGNLSFRAPATMPSPWSEPSATASAPSPEPTPRTASSSAATTETLAASAAAGSGPPTQSRRHTRSAGRPTSTQTPTNKTMEPKRPDERYGRFR